ncbi:MAG: helix-turn-helix domain-containing protein [Myxococcota bacterium]
MAAEIHNPSSTLTNGSVPSGEHLEDLARTADQLPLREFLARAEAWRIARALREHRGNRSAAARALGIGRRTLYTKMEKLGLVPVWTVRGEKGNE